MTTALILQAAIALVGFLVYRQLFRKTHKNLPPGPKPLPIVGNFLDLPRKGTVEWEHWLKHKDTYGPISSVTVLGQNIIILHDQQAAQELLEKESLKSSNRPVLDFANYCGFGEFLVNRQMNELFKRQRRLCHQAMGTKALAAKYSHVQEVEAGRLLLRTLERPGDLIEHFRTEAGAIILKIIYGYTIDPEKEDPLVELIGRMTEDFSRVSMPFTQLVELIPTLKALPEGFPLTGFKTEARLCNEAIRAVLDIPYDFVRKQMAAGNHTESFISKLVQEGLDSDAGEPSVSEVKDIKLTAGAMYGGGAETTTSTMASFALAMAMFPDAQRRAQAEMDRVTGGTRLPGLQDRDQMPYVDAMVSEALRWFPILPMGIPHALSEDMTYSGFDLPKGSYIMPAVWWMMHDPDVYANPSAFTPERFLAPRNEPDPCGTVFGYGRRICPGRFLADSSLFLSIAQLLAAFDIGRAKDAQGKVIEPQLVYKPGVIVKPKEFAYTIVPRSEKHAEFVRCVEREHPWAESDVKLLGKIPSPHE